MTELIPMTKTEYSRFLQLANQAYMADQIKAGNWSTDEAEQKMQQTIEKYLPNGFETPGHHFYNILVPDIPSPIGALWYWVREENDQPQIFIMEISIEAEYRRKGYGTQVFDILEQHAKDRDIHQIGLSVFPHNTPARNLYLKLGFSFLDSDHYMVKQLVTNTTNLQN